MAYSTCCLCGDYKNCSGITVLIKGKKVKRPICAQCLEDVEDADEMGMLLRDDYENV